MENEAYCVEGKKKKVVAARDDFRCGGAGQT